MKLVIFDMDETLVEVIGVHDEATRRVFRSFFGVEANLTGIDYAGRSLDNSFRALAALNGVPENKVRDKLAGMLRAYDEAFAGSLPADATGTILPGVIPLLDALSATDNLLVLYSGDSPAVMRSVMEATGLGKYFRYRFSGTEVATRADMVRQAIAVARQIAGRELEGKDIVIIGDSIRDIEAGRSFGARTIAVATGIHTRDELKAAGPYCLFDSLEDWRAVMRAID
jgi:phosphoglycolate phosphatase